MICSEKERESCNVEKLTCEGCYYNKPNKEGIYKILLNSEITDYNALLNEIYAIRDKTKEKQDYTICVNGYISVDVLNRTLNLEKQARSLEAKIKDLKEIEAEHKKINVELREKEQETKKALELINSYIAEILKK